MTRLLYEHKNRYIGAGVLNPRYNVCSISIVDDDRALSVRPTVTTFKTFLRGISNSRAHPFRRAFARDLFSLFFCLIFISYFGSLPYKAMHKLSEVLPVFI